MTSALDRYYAMTLGMDVEDTRQNTEGRRPNAGGGGTEEGGRPG
jgi:hypothetical protein